MIRLVEYLDAHDRSPFARWRAELDDRVRARIGIATVRLSNGNFSSVKGVAAGLFEMRLDFGPGYRIYFGKEGDTLVILLGGGTKKRQHLDIARAQSNWRDYSIRKRVKQWPSSETIPTASTKTFATAKASGASSFGKP